MGSALLGIFLSRLLVYSAGAGLNRVQVVLSGLIGDCFVLFRQQRYVGMVVYIFVALVFVCVDVMVM